MSTQKDAGVSVDSRRGRGVRRDLLP